MSTELTIVEGDPIRLEVSLGPSVLDGNKADVSVSGGGSTWTVGALRGRTVAPDAPTNGYALVWNATASQWEPQAQAAGIADGDKGDVTVSSSGATWTVDNDAITFAKFQNVEEACILGRETGVGTGDVKVVKLDTQFVWTTIGGKPALSISVPSDATKVDTTRQVATGTGLTGGGNLSADRTIAIATSGVTETLIADDAVTFAKMQNVSTDRLLGRDTASSGNAEELTVGNGLEFTGSGGIGVANDGVTYARIQNVTAASRLLGRGSASGSGDVEEISLGTGLTMSGTTLSSSAGISDGDKGDVTVSASGATWTIDNDAVTFAKMQNVVTSRVLGRTSSGSGDIEELTVGNGLVFGSGVLNGQNVTVDSQEFHLDSGSQNSNTWTKPANAQTVIYWGCGGGQGGANGSASAPGAGGAGANGALVVIPAALLGATESVTVGAGGAANSGEGGTTTFAGNAFPGARGGTTPRSIATGIGAQNGWGGGDTADGSDGRHGGFGAGGGGGGSTFGGKAGGKAHSFEMIAGQATAQIGGGAAGGTTNGGNGTAANSANDRNGFGEGAGGGGGHGNPGTSGATGGNGGAGRRGSGGGGAGRSGVGGPTTNGGVGGGGYLRVLTICFT